MLFENEFIKCDIKPIDNCQNIHITGVVYNRHNYKNVVFVANNPIDKKHLTRGQVCPFRVQILLLKELKMLQWSMIQEI